MFHSAIVCDPVHEIYKTAQAATGILPQMFVPRASNLPAPPHARTRIPRLLLHLLDGPYGSVLSEYNKGTADAFITKIEIQEVDESYKRIME